MKVTYIGHSGFLLVVSNAYFLFDYYEGDIPEMNREYPLVVFVSHKHADHYNPAIFELAKKYPNVHYVVSRYVPVKWKIQEYMQQGISLEDKVSVVRKNTDTELVLPGQKETLKMSKKVISIIVCVVSIIAMIIYTVLQLVGEWRGNISIYVIGILYF